MNRSNVVLVLVVLIIGLLSCEELEQLYVSEDLVAKIPYADGQQITFESDSFPAIELTAVRTRRTFEVSACANCKPSYRGESVEISFSENPNDFNKFLTFEATDQSDTLLFFTLSNPLDKDRKVSANVIFSKEDLYYCENDGYACYDEFTLDNNTYQDVMRIAFDTTDNDVPYGIYEVFYTESSGIVHFKTADGNSWNLK